MYAVGAAQGGVYGNPKLDAEKGFGNVSEYLRNAYGTIPYIGRPERGRGDQVARAAELLRRVKSHISSDEIKDEYDRIARRSQASDDVLS